MDSNSARIGTALILALSVLAASGAGKPKAELPLPPLNAKVVEFARAQAGKKVGNGECTSLAVAAYKEAGARRFRLNRVDGDYVWGRPVASFSEALPGDVLQFRDAVFKGRTPLPKRRVRIWHEEFPHHTAVVAEVKDGGRLLTLLHQNVGPDGTPEEKKKVVQEGTLRPLALQKGGRVWIYRPVGPDDPFDPADNPPQPITAPSS